MFSKVSFERSSIEALIWRVLGVMALFAMHIMLGRSLAPENYGEVSFTLATTSTLAMLVSIGLPTLSLQYIPKYMYSKQWVLCGGFIYKSILLIVLISLLAAVSLVLIYVVFGLSSSALYIAILLPWVSIILFKRRVVQALHSVKDSVIPDEIMVPFFLSGALLVWDINSSTKVLNAYFVIIVMIFLLSVLRIRKMLPREVISSRYNYESTKILSLSFPLLVGSIGQLALNQSGVIILGMIGSMVSVGIYSAAMRFAILITFCMTSVNLIGAPMLASAYHSKDVDKFKSLIFKGIVWSIVGGLPIFIVTIAMPEYLLGIMGPKFLAGADVLRILSIGFLISVSTGLAGTVLNMTGNTIYFAATMTIASLCAILGMFYLIPNYGAIGAAIVYSLCLALVNIVHLIKVNSILLRMKQQLVVD